MSILFGNLERDPDLGWRGSGGGGVEDGGHLVGAGDVPDGDPGSVGGTDQLVRGREAG